MMSGTRSALDSRQPSSTEVGMRRSRASSTVRTGGFIAPSPSR